MDLKRSIFGSHLRDRILILLELKETSHLRELARTFAISVPAVQRAVKRLELDGIIVGRLVGRSRVLQLNPHFFAYRELRTLLHEVVLKRPDLYEPAEKVRSRPRRSGKPL